MLSIINNYIFAITFLTQLHYNYTYIVFKIPIIILYYHAVSIIINQSCMSAADTL